MLPDKACFFRQTSSYFDRNRNTVSHCDMKDESVNVNTLAICSEAIICAN